MLIPACVLFTIADLTATEQGADAALPSGLVHLWSGNGDVSDDVGGADGTPGSTTASS